MRLRTMRKDEHQAPWLGEGRRSVWLVRHVHPVARPVAAQVLRAAWWSLHQKTNPQRMLAY